MAARSKEIATRSLGDVEPGGDAVGGQAATTAVVESHKPPARAETRVVREPAADAAKTVVSFLAERRII
jgi:electron transfer flavoprotein alpha/beta subunit